MKKTIILFLTLWILALANLAVADYCGGEFGGCECGDTVMQNLQLSEGLDCQGLGLIVGASGITIDCDENQISGNGTDIGILINGKNGVTIKNCGIAGFQTGIYAVNSEGITILGNSLQYNGVEQPDRSGIHLNNVSDSSIINNTISYNDYGIYMEWSNGNTITGNTLTHNSYQAIFMSLSNNNLISGGEIGNNNENSGLGHGGVYIWGSSGNTISGVYMHNNREAAVYLETFYGEETVFSSDNTIQHNNIENNCGGTAGIFAYGSVNLLIFGNNITHGTGYGIYSDMPYNISIINNYIFNNTLDEVWLRNAELGKIQGNTISCAAEPFWDEYYGVHIESHTGLEMAGNNISNCHWGIYAWDSNGIVISDEIHSNSRGIYIQASGEDEVVHILGSNIYGNGEGARITNSKAAVTDTDFINNRDVVSGLHVENSHVELTNSNFIGNGGWGIYEQAEEPGTVIWNINQPVDCIDNNIFIYGKINGADFINAENCQITLNEMEACSSSFGECGCGEIALGDVTLTENLECTGSNGLSVGADFITIDCAGNSIIGGGGFSGIAIDGLTGVTVKNCTIENFMRGVSVTGGSSNITITGNFFVENIDGVYSHGQDDSPNLNINVLGNSFENHERGSRGVYFRNTGGGSITGNSINSTLSFTGVLLESAGIVSHNTISGNLISVSTESTGINIIDSDNLVSSNTLTCTGSPSYGIYLNGAEGYAEGNTFTENEISGCEYGFYATQVGDFVIVGDNYHDNDVGLYMESCGGEGTGPTIANAVIQDNCEGARISGSPYVTLSDPDFSGNYCGGDTGLYIGNSHVMLLNGKFENNGDYGILDQSIGTLQWVVTKLVNCTNNDVKLASGFIVPFGGRIIRNNCTISILNGEEYEELPDNVAGRYTEQITTNYGNNFQYIVGSPDYGVEAIISTTDDAIGKIQIDFYTEPPAGGSAFRLEKLGVWVDVTVTGDVLDYLDYWILRIYYTDEMVEAAGLDESSLKISYYNPDTGRWRILQSTVNRQENYVEARLNHFSLFGVGGSLPSSSKGEGGTSGSGNMFQYTYHQLTREAALRINAMGGLNRVRFMHKGAEHFISPTAYKAGESATFLVTSTPQYVLVPKGESVRVDLDGDEVYDLKITLHDVTTSTADVSFSLIEEPVTVQQPKTTTSVAPTPTTIPPAATPTTVPPPAGQTPTTKQQSISQQGKLSPSALWAYVLLALVLVLVVVYYFFKKG